MPTNRLRPFEIAVDHVLYAPLGVMLQHHAWRKNVSGIVQARLPLFWGVSKTAQSSMDRHFKSAEEVARLIQQFLSAGVQRGSPLLAQGRSHGPPPAGPLSGVNPPQRRLARHGRP